jgi:hypothetical protein
MRHQVKMLIATVVVETHLDVSVRGAFELDRRSAMSVSILLLSLKRITTFRSEELSCSTGVVQCLFKDKCLIQLE